MNIQEKVQRAQKTIDSIATHDDESVARVQDALETVAVYAKNAGTAAKTRRLGNAVTRFLRYWKSLGRALAGKA